MLSRCTSFVTLDMVPEYLTLTQREITRQKAQLYQINSNIPDPQQDTCTLVADDLKPCFNIFASLGTDVQTRVSLQILSGNDAGTWNDVVKHTLSRTVVAKYVRLIAISGYYYGLRMEYYGCRKLAVERQHADFGACLPQRRNTSQRISGKRLMEHLCVCYRGQFA